VQIRIASFNVENLTDEDGEPTIDLRTEVLRPQFERMNADIVCLQEVHAQDVGDGRALRALDTVLAGTAYKHYERHFSTIESGEPRRLRNLVTLTRFPIVEADQVMNDLVGRIDIERLTGEDAGEIKEIGVERPILHTTIDAGAAGRLHVINLHLKSRLPTTIAGEQDRDHRWRWLSAAGWAEGYFLSSLKRMTQALETRLLIDRILDTDPDAQIIVAGDLNADVDEVPVEAILGRTENTQNPDLVGRVLFAVESTVPEPSRYTLFHQGRPSMLDHILVTRNLIGAYRSTEIHNELLHDESIAFATDDQYPESDHAPVVAMFDFARVVDLRVTADEPEESLNRA